MLSELQSKGNRATKFGIHQPSKEVLHLKAILDTGKSIYLQIFEAVEDDILSGMIQEEELIPSTNQFAKQYAINPATAAKGVNLLVDEGLVYKKRGIGMCVAGGAKKKILQKRKNSFYQNFLVTILEEAEKLNLSKAELIQMIQEGNTFEK